ncbi:glycoside hydrolase family 43 protein [Georgenia sp. MJ206]|uniref:glycoside hydrolase family 43 protein n=1 Tax=Georgenia wangjunii TaxID=3117730 RepID=UPI002F2664BE
MAQLPVEVTALATDDENAQIDCTSAIQSDLTDVRGNLMLPTVGSEWGSTIAWASSAPDVISTSGWVTRPANGEAAANVTLTATATLNDAVATCTYDVTVTPMPEEKVYERYLFASFHGGDDGGRNGEQIWISASKGNDPFNWYEVNYEDGTSVSDPILQTVTPPRGTTGLRDPSLIRSADGDRFYLLATDLKTYQDGQSWSYRQSRGSRNLVIYESDDLINWSEPRFVEVEDEHAGNVWAPEAFYDPNLGQYIVFWSSNLYPDTDIANRNTSQISYNRVRIAMTRDFVTFTEPTSWINLDRSTGRQGWGMIDSTMIATDDKIYRLTKDENGFRVLLQSIDSWEDLYDTWGAEETTPHVVNRNPINPLTENPNAWTMVGDPNGSSKWQIPGLSGGNLEGPLVFKDNVEDMYYVFIDYASGGGYVAWRSPSMDLPPDEWEYLGQSWCNTTGLSSNCTAESETSPYWSLPVSPRHGSVLPVTLEEWEAVMSHYNSPVHVETSLVTEDGSAVAEDEWVNEAPELEVTWTDFNGTDHAPAWLRLVEGHNDGPRVVSPDIITSGITQGMTLPVNAVEGTNWAQVEYRDASLGGDDVMLWTVDVSYKLDTTAPTVTASVDGAELTIAATDPAPANGAENSGLASCEYQVEDGAWTDCAPTVTLDAAAGDRTITAVATDNAGNETTVTTVAEGTGLDVTTDVAMRCVVGRTVLAVRLGNDSEVPVNLEVSSSYGSKSFTNLAPGRGVAQAFTTRAVNIPAGEVEVTARAMIDGEEFTQTFVEDYSASSCGG